MIAKFIDHTRVMPDYNTGTARPVMLYLVPSEPELGSFMSRETLVWLLEMRKSVAESRARRQGTRKEAQQ